MKILLNVIDFVGKCPSCNSCNKEEGCCHCKELLKFAEDCGYGFFSSIPDGFSDCEVVDLKSADDCMYLVVYVKDGKIQTKLLGTEILYEID